MTRRDITPRQSGERPKTNRIESECPECGGSIAPEGRERICTACGLVVDADWIDHSHGRMVIDDQDRDRVQTGAPLTPSRHDRGLSAEMGRTFDGQGNLLPWSRRRRLRRLRVQDDRAKWASKAERNLAHAFGEIARLTDRLELPRSVRDRASVVFKSAQAENLIVGRSLDSMAAASVYAACRESGILRTIDEILEVAACSESSFLNAYRAINVELGIKAVPPKVSDFVAKFSAECDFPDAVRRYALELAKTAGENIVAGGCKPSGVAAGCLYLAGQELGFNLGQGKLAGVAGISEVTVRLRFRDLRELRDTR